jgi:hypothetical protein
MPWSFVAAVILLVTGTGLAVAGVAVPDADRLLDVGGPLLSAGIAIFTGRGIDAIQATRTADPG